MNDLGPQNSPWFIVAALFAGVGGVTSYLIWGPHQTADQWGWRSLGIGLAAAVVVGVGLLWRSFRR